MICIVLNFFLLVVYRSDDCVRCIARYVVLIVAASVVWQKRCCWSCVCFVVNHVSVMVDFVLTFVYNTSDVTVSQYLYS